LVFNLKQWAHEGDPVLSDLARRFISRRLFKASDLDMARDLVPQFLDRAAAVVTRLGLDPRYYLILDKASDIPYYEYYLPGRPQPDGQTEVETVGPKSEIREISEVSAVVRGMKGYQIERICYPAELSGEIGSLLTEFFRADTSRSIR